MLDKLIAEVMRGMTGGAQGVPGLQEMSGGGRPAAGGESPLMQIILQLLAGGTSGGGRQAGGDPLGGLLSGLAGTSRGAAGGNPLEALVGAILGGQGGGGGGIGGLLAQLQGSGFGREADSWVSRGANLPVGPEQITQAFGRDRLETLARQHGMDVDEMTAGLSAELPGVVDELTPQGRLPQRDELSGLFAGLGGRASGSA